MNHKQILSRTQRNKPKQRQGVHVTCEISIDSIVTAADTNLCIHRDESPHNRLSRFGFFSSHFREHGRGSKFISSRNAKPQNNCEEFYFVSLVSFSVLFKLINRRNRGRFLRHIGMTHSIAALHSCPLTLA